MNSIQSFIDGFYRYMMNGDYFTITMLMIGLLLNVNFITTPLLKSSPHKAWTSKFYQFLFCLLFAIDLVEIVRQLVSIYQLELLTMQSFCILIIIWDTSYGLVLMLLSWRYFVEVLYYTETFDRHPKPQTCPFKKRSILLLILAALIILLPTISAGYIHYWLSDTNIAAKGQCIFTNLSQWSNGFGVFLNLITCCELMLLFLTIPFLICIYFGYRSFWSKEYSFSLNLEWCCCERLCSVFKDCICPKKKRKNRRKKDEPNSEEDQTSSCFTAFFLMLMWGIHLASKLVGIFPYLLVESPFAVINLNAVILAGRPLLFSTVYPLISPMIELIAEKIWNFLFKCLSCGCGLPCKMGGCICCGADIVKFFLKTWHNLLFILMVLLTSTLVAHHVPNENIKSLESPPNIVTDTFQSWNPKSPGGGGMGGFPIIPFIPSPNLPNFAVNGNEDEDGVGGGNGNGNDNKDEEKCDYCVFPFIYNGKPYKGCTTDGETYGPLTIPHQPWCATSVNEETRVMKPGMYKTCQKECKHECPICGGDCGLVKGFEIADNSLYESADVESSEECESFFNGVCSLTEFNSSCNAFSVTSQRRLKRDKRTHSKVSCKIGANRFKSGMRATANKCPRQISPKVGSYSQKIEFVAKQAIEVNFIHDKTTIKKFLKDLERKGKKSHIYGLAKRTIINHIKNNVGTKCIYIGVNCLHSDLAKKFEQITSSKLELSKSQMGDLISGMISSRWDNAKYLRRLNKVVAIGAVRSKEAKIGCQLVNELEKTLVGPIGYPFSFCQPTSTFSVGEQRIKCSNMMQGGGGGKYADEASLKGYKYAVLYLGLSDDVKCRRY